jgi:putative flippase GtrA
VTRVLADLRNYMIAGAVSVAIVLSVAAALREIGDVPERGAVAIALLVGLGVNFTLFRRFVFPGQVLGVGRQLAETVVTSILFRGTEYVIFLFLNLTLRISYLLATGLALCVSNVGKFAVYRHVVFSRSRRAARTSIPPG